MIPRHSSTVCSRHTAFCLWNMTSSQTTRQAEVRSSAAVDSPPVGSWDGLLGLPLLCHRCFLDNNGNINSSDLKSKRFGFNYEPRIIQDLVGLVQVLRLSLLKPMEHRFFCVRRRPSECTFGRDPRIGSRNRRVARLGLGLNPL